MKKLTALILAGLFLLTSCTTGTTVDPVTGETIPKPDKITESPDDTEAETEEIVTRTTHLTGIFEKEAFPRAADSYYARNYAPDFDENGNFRIFGKFGEGDDRKWGVATVAPDGTVLNRIDFVQYDTSDSVDLMTVTDDTIYYAMLSSGGYEKQNLGVFVAACGAFSTGKMLDITDYFSDFHPEIGDKITAICTDRDGNVYLGTELEVAVLTPELTVKFMLKPEGGVTAMRPDRNGTVYIASGREDTYGLYPIDPEKKGLGTPILLGDLRIPNLFFAEGYDFYYTDHETAVFGVNFPAEEEAQPRVTKVLDFNNSGVGHTTFTLMNVKDPETMVVVETEYFSNFPKVPVLFKKAPDRPLEDITVIEVAYTTSDYYFEADVMEFNRTHKDIMVVLQDYSRFDNDIEPDAGEKRLAMDVVTGVYRPDIILGTYDQPVVKTVVDEGNYVNLMPYVSTDTLVSKDRIFPGILYSYSTDDGNLWGLPLDFSANTLIANDAVTGGLTEWDFGEMIAFASSLPDDVALLQHLSRDTAVDFLLGNNPYAAFVDLKAGTCNFDTPEFAQFLEFLKSLPSQPRYGTNEEEYLQRHNGKAALYAPYFCFDMEDWLNRELIFNTAENTVIGFPVADGSSDKHMKMTFKESYTILSSCEYPDSAWEFIRFMLGDEFIYSHFANARDLPILMDKCRGIAEKHLGYIYNWYFAGGGFGFNPNTEEAREMALAEPLREPGIRIIPTAEMVDEYMDYLINNTGMRIVNRIPDEINAIVNEEIKTYLTGVKDAKSCANVIQSRVNIWLAEHE